MSPPTRKDEPSLPLSNLLEILELLVAQCQAYERALPFDNYPARAAVTTLGELARQAANEARELNSLQEKTLLTTTLSPRENEVLDLASQGLINKEIAYRLGISERTVQFHMNSIFNKTGAQSRTEAVALALRNHWLKTDSG